VFDIGRSTVDCAFFANARSMPSLKRPWLRTPAYSVVGFHTATPVVPFGPIAVNFNSVNFSTDRLDKTRDLCLESTSVDSTYSLFSSQPPESRDSQPAQGQKVKIISFPFILILVQLWLKPRANFYNF
jgi:hypothetical protein